MEYGVSVPVEMCVMFIHMCHSHYKVQTCLLYNAKSLLFCRSLKRKHWFHFSVLIFFLFVTFMIKLLPFICFFLSIFCTACMSLKFVSSSNTLDDTLPDTQHIFLPLSLSASFRHETYVAVILMHFNWMMMSLTSHLIVYFFVRCFIAILDVFFIKLWLNKRGASNKLILSFEFEVEKKYQKLIKPNRVGLNSSPTKNEFDSSIN